MTDYQHVAAQGDRLLGSRTYVAVHLAALPLLTAMRQTDLETASDPGGAVLALCDHLREDQDRVRKAVQAKVRGGLSPRLPPHPEAFTAPTAGLDEAAAVLAHCLPEQTPDTAAIRAVVDRLLRVQFDTQPVGSMFTRFDHPDALFLAWCPTGPEARHFPPPANLAGNAAVVVRVRSRPPGGPDAWAARTMLGRRFVLWTSYPGG